jgi:hypothetical protein
MIEEEYERVKELFSFGSCELCYPDFKKTASITSSFPVLFSLLL